MSEQGTAGDTAARIPPMGEIRRALAAHDPVTRGDLHRWAATALILHAGGADDARPETLFIRRTDRDGDPWSGHVALPGGRFEEGDRSLAGTAAREAAEEVGVRLPDPIGQLDDVTGRVGSGGVATFVFEVPARPELRLEAREVDRAMWVPLTDLADVANHTRHPVRGIGPFPGIRLGEDVLWGMTLRTIEHLFSVLGLRLRR